VGLFALAQKVRGHFSVNPPYGGGSEKPATPLGEVTPPAQH